MSEESKKLEGLVGKFLKGLAITSLSLAGIGCIPAEEPWAEWPVAKVRNTKKQKYERHVDDRFAEGIFREENHIIYDYLRFNRKHIESSYKIGRQSVVRLKHTCGADDLSVHGPECIPKSVWGAGEGNNLDGQTVLVTLRKDTLHYVLESDETSCADVEYDPNGAGKGIPALIIREYRVIDGRVKNPLPAGYGTGKRIEKIGTWYDIIRLDNFLRANFDGDSIFTKDDVFEARYFNDSNRTLGGVISVAESVKTKRRSILERASLLEDYARRYKRVSSHSPDENITQRAEAKLKLKEAYNSLMDEINSKTWKTDPNSRLKRPYQKDKVLENLREAANYLGI